MKLRLGAVCLAAVFVRLLLPVAVAVFDYDLSVFQSPDTSSYWVPAETLAADGAFASGDEPEIRRTPGYPLFLVVGFQLGSPVWITILLQVALGVLSVFGVHELTRRTNILPEGLRDRAAILSAVLYAFDPLSIFYTSQILTETLFTTIFIWHLYALVRYVTTRQLRFVAIAGALAACAVFVRPVAYYWPFVPSGILLGYAIFGSRVDSRRVLAATLLLFVALTPLFGWQVRNAQQTGYTGFSAIREHNLYSYAGAAVVSREEGSGFLDTRTRLLNRLDEKVLEHGWGQAERYEYMGNEGVQMIWTNVATYVAIHLEGLIRVVADPGGNEFFRFFDYDALSSGLLVQAVDEGVVSTFATVVRVAPAVVVVSLVLATMLFLQIVLAGIGLTVVGQRREVATLLVASVVYMLFVSGGPTAHARFRHPIMPVVVVFAAFGAVKMRGKIGGCFRNGVTQATCND